MTLFLSLTLANIRGLKDKLNVRVWQLLWLRSFSTSFKAQKNGTEESEHRHQSPDSFDIQISSLRH